jgi:hypothetical protein
MSIYTPVFRNQQCYIFILFSQHFRVLSCRVLSRIPTCNCTGLPPDPLSSHVSGRPQRYLGCKSDNKIYAVVLEHGQVNTDCFTLALIRVHTRNDGDRRAKRLGIVNWYLIALLRAQCERACVSIQVLFLKNLNACIPVAALALSERLKVPAKKSVSKNGDAISFRSQCRS